MYLNKRLNTGDGMGDRKGGKIARWDGYSGSEDTETGEIAFAVGQKSSPYKEDSCISRPGSISTAILFLPENCRVHWRAHFVCLS